jgi:hypothetical protein
MPPWHRCRTGATAAAAAALAAGATTGCGSGVDDGEAKAVALRALAAYADGDARTLCRLTPAAKKAQLSRGTTCMSFYAKLFVQQSGQDAIDQAMRPPYRPGPVRSVRRDGERTVVTVHPGQLNLTALQRRGLRLRYGRKATALQAPAPIAVTVTREGDALVAGF